MKREPNGNKLQRAALPCCNLAEDIRRSSGGRRIRRGGTRPRQQSPQDPFIWPEELQAASAYSGTQETGIGRQQPFAVPAARVSPALGCKESFPADSPRLRPITRRTMRVSALLPLACVCVALLWGHGGGATPFPFNMSAEGSGEGEPEILDPTAYTTHSPVLMSTTSRVTTVTRIKHFIFHQVVDFLRENLLLIIVVCSLVIVLIFIVCCASVMSHKRKLTAYYPSSFPTKKYVDQKDKLGGARTFSDVHAKPPNCQQPAAGDPSQSVTKNLRTPSKALVGDKGKETSARPCDVENKQEETPKEERRPAENEVASGNNGAQTQGLVCLCHLRKGNPPSSSQNSPGMEGRVAQSDANPATAKVQGVMVD